MKHPVLPLFLALLISSCSGSSDKAVSSAPEAPKASADIAVEAAPAVDDLESHPGLALYNLHCLPCHQADGNGVPGMYPPLIETKWVNGDVKELIDIVVKGMNEEIEVDGEIYNQIMAPLPHLTNQQVAEILTFVRKKFGTDGSEVSVEEVSKHRDNS